MNARRRFPTPSGQALWSLVLLLGSSLPQTSTGELRAQTLQDVVLTMGMSGEGYAGNLASATLPVVDSTNSVGAAVAESGMRGTLVFLNQPSRALAGSFDLGIRQFLASGFELRDYAPRETAARAQLQFVQRWLGVGALRVFGDARRRRIDDRPPMPLFLQPGYDRLMAGAQFTSVSIDGVTIDVGVDVETANYDAPESVSKIDLLDRDSRAVAVGLTWGDGYDVRVHGSYRELEFPRQGSFDERDPFRRDRMITVGGSWRYQRALLAEIGIEAIVNRSNSRRPEYDAVSLRTRVGAPLPIWDLGLNLYAVVTGKSYVDETPFARLVPGEEADNATIIYLDVNRPINARLDAALRVGFTRAETDIGRAYFRRYGLSVLLNYRPDFRPRSSTPR